jgi:DNA-binding NtrC family response regulator
VYGIIQQNHGFIDVVSELGRGTTFKIYLPKYLNGGTILKTDVEAPACDSKTILVVEDESSLLGLITKMLEEEKYIVISTSSPKAAIHLATNSGGKIDLLITDVLMPEMNGKDLRLKITEVCPNVKSIFMSGYTEDVISENGLIDKNLNFIQKPFSQKDFFILIRKVLDKNDNELE